MDVRVRSTITFAGRDDGPVVMLAHGFGRDQNMWRQVTARLGEQSRLLNSRPVTLDAIGPRPQLSAPQATVRATRHSWPRTGE